MYIHEVEYCGRDRQDSYTLTVFLMIEYISVANVSCTLQLMCEKTILHIHKNNKMHRITFPPKDEGNTPESLSTRNESHKWKI